MSIGENMTTTNKSDSLQPPEGGGFSPTLLMTMPRMSELRMGQSFSKSCKGFISRRDGQRKRKVSMADLRKGRPYACTGGQALISRREHNKRRMQCQKQ